MKALINLVIIATSVAVLAGADHDSIVWGFRLNSPDGKFTAELVKDEEGYIHIIDNQTKARFKVGSLYPIYAMQWANDSRTLVTTEHIAGGSVAFLIHLNDEKWTRSKASPPEETLPSYYHFAVVEQVIAKNAIKLKYKISEERGNGEKIDFFTCSFDVSPEGIIKNVSKIPIDAEIYDRLDYKRPKVR